MNRIFIIIALIFMVSCDSQTKRKSADSLSVKDKDTTRPPEIKEKAFSKKAVDSLVRVGAIDPDSIDSPPPAQSEEKEKLRVKYNQITMIDSTIINNTDTLQFHLKYYCLKDLNIVVPAIYDTDNKPPKEFVTHPFVTFITLIHNRDTVLTKRFQASDFNPFFNDNYGGNLKKFGSVLMPHFYKRNKVKNQIMLSCSISIPATDIGIGMFLILSKDGKYKIIESH